MFTIIKVILVLVFVAMVAMAVESPQAVRLLPAEDDGTLMLSSAFAVSLIYVNYAFTGWNAATYIISEVEDSQKNIPLVLFVGTVTVLLLYLMLNYTFLYAAPMQAMEGKLEIGVIVARSAFGETGGVIMGAVSYTHLTLPTTPYV